MGTASRIAIKTPSGYRSIYAHWDGYPQGVGAMLKRHYNNPSKIKQLMTIGDISSLKKNIGVKHPFSPFGDKNMTVEKYDKLHGNMTTSYRRDRGEKNAIAKLSKSLAHLKDIADRAGGAEFLYIYSNGSWKVYAFKYSTREWLSVPSYNRGVVKRKPVKKKVVKRIPAKRSTRIIAVRQTGRSNIARDRKRKALAPGKRRSRTGRIYYERRRNRSDVGGVDTPRKVVKKRESDYTKAKRIIKAKFAEPRKKSSGKWGLRGSTSLDRNTQKEAYMAQYKYLKGRGLIK